MQYAADLADPLLDVRNVVESFRSYHVTPLEWEDTLRNAIAALSRLQGLGQFNIVPPGLLPDLALLLAGGLDRSPQVVDKVATEVANILDETAIPGPTLEDDDWSFGGANLGLSSGYKLGLFLCEKDMKKMPSTGRIGLV
jgi:hypothetical protein